MGQIGGVVVQVGEPEPLGGHRVISGVTAEDVVVQHDGQDGYLVAHGGFDVHPGHADGGVAHDVDHHLVGSAQLGAHGYAQAVSQLGRVAPSQVTPGHDGFVEGDGLVPRVARVVGYHSVCAVHSVHQVPDHPVWIDGRLVRGQ